MGPSVGSNSKRSCHTILSLSFPSMTSKNKYPPKDCVFVCACFIEYPFCLLVLTPRMLCQSLYHDCGGQRFRAHSYQESLLYSEKVLWMRQMRFGIDATVSAPLPAHRLQRLGSHVMGPLNRRAQIESTKSNFLGNIFTPTLSKTNPKPSTSRFREH